MPKLPSWSVQDYERAFVITALVGLFGFALVYEMVWSTDEKIKDMLIGALIGAFVGNALQYLFGTTVNSGRKDDTALLQAENVRTALLSTPPPTAALPTPSASGPGTPVAAFLVLAGVSLALLLSGPPASASELPRRSITNASIIGPNCGWPVPDPACHASDIKTAPPTQDAFNTLKKLIIDDVTWAKNKAASDSPPDTRHGKCWTAILAWLTGPNSPTFVPPHLGIASALQMSFDASGGIGKFIPDDVADGCGATALDARIELLRLLNDIGMTALLPK